MQDLNISLVQTSLAWEDPAANLKHFGEKIYALEEATDLILLPEMFNTGFTMNAEAHAEEMHGPTMKWMDEIAGEKQCTLCGSLIINENGRYFNRLVWMRPDGSHAYYDKKHLFRMGDEHLHFTAGTKRLVVELKGWHIMPLVCYDLRFPVWSKNEYRDDTYVFDLLLYVANWPEARSLAWTSLLTGRAIENMAYAVGVNRIGKDGRGYEYNGRSMIAAPDGQTILNIPAGRDMISTVTLKADAMLELRAKMGVGNDWDKFELF